MLSYLLSFYHTSAHHTISHATLPRCQGTTCHNYHGTMLLWCHGAMLSRHRGNLALLTTGCVGRRHPAFVAAYAGAAARSLRSVGLEQCREILVNAGLSTLDSVGRLLLCADGCVKGSQLALVRLFAFTPLTLQQVDLMCKAAA